MTPFEYFLFIPGIVISLAVTNVLTGVGRVVHRYAGKGVPIRLDWAHAGWVLGLFQWIFFLWWYSYRWGEAHQITMIAFGFLVSYAVLLFVLCAILVPIDMDDVNDFGEHFMAVRGWFYPIFALLILTDFADSAAKGLDNFLSFGTQYIAVRTLAVIGCLVGIRVTSRLYHVVFAWGLLVWSGLFFWLQRPAL